MRKHFPEITIARGIIALLVIVGHAFPDGDRFMTDAVARFIHDFIYSFHMGAFIFIAGFVAAPKLLEGCDLRQALRSRFLRLMVPYLCWTAVLLLLKQPFGSLARAQFSPRLFWQLLIGAKYLGWLWYLWTLFFISALFLLLYHRLHNPRWGLLLGLILYLLHPLIPDSPLARVGQYAIFYGLGIWVRAHWDGLPGWIDRPIVPAFGLILCAASALLPLPYLISGCAGTCLTLHLARRIAARPSRACEHWTELGERSYDVYLLGYYVQTPLRVAMDTLLHVPYWPQVLLCAALGLLIPMLLSRSLASRAGWFRRAFLGHVR